MKIVSVNVSSEQLIEFNGTKVKTGIFKLPTDNKVVVNRLGVEGDAIVDLKVHGGLDQAVYLYHKEDYDWWSEKLGKPIAYGTFGENLTIEGVQDIDWIIGDRMVINDVVLEISAPRAPCFKLGVRMGDSKFVKMFVQACRPGAYARVLNEGSLQQGDHFTVQQTDEDYASVKAVFVEWHNKSKSRPMIEQALRSPLASVHREALEDWYQELGN